MRKGLRISMFVAGLLVGLLGLLLWAVDRGEVNLVKVATPYGVEVWESETGSLSGSAEFSTPEQLEAAGGELVFSGSLIEADAYIADRLETSGFSWLEVLLIGMGVVLMASAFLPPYSRKEPKKAPVERKPVLAA